MLRWLCGWPNIICFLNKSGWDYPFRHHIIGVFFVVSSGIPIRVKALRSFGMEVLIVFKIEVRMNQMPIKNTKILLKIPAISLYRILRFRLIGKRRTQILDFGTLNFLYKVTYQAFIFFRSATSNN